MQFAFRVSVLEGVASWNRPTTEDIPIEHL